MAAGTVEHAYSYVSASTCEVSAGGAALRLRTSGGVARNPRLFAGELAAPGVQAAALLVVGRCARSQFFDRTGSPVLDPVVTCHADRLRFEALSSCAGVYARHDSDLSGVDGEVLRPGVTNVDFNQQTRTVLARVASGSSLHLDVGEDGIEVSTDGAQSFERRVELPVRWVKGFAEVGAAQRTMDVAFELGGVFAQRFLRALPSGAGVVHAIPGVREPRWSTRAGRCSVAVGNPNRLALLAPLARHATRLVVRTAANGTSAWQLDTAAGRTHLVVSPLASRGFSGEGGTLTSLAADRVAPVADQLVFEMAWQPELDPDVLAARSGQTPDEVPAGLDLLAARGHAGFDVATGAYFHRELPYDLSRIETLHPRLIAARQLLAGGQVELTNDAQHAWVRTPAFEHRVRLSETPPACSCRWWTEHRGSRGPCKHVLAAQMLSASRRRATP